MNGRSRSLRAITGVALAASLAAGFAAWRRAEHASERTAALEREVARLHETLDERTAERGALEAELAQLRAALGAAREPVAISGPPPAPAEAEAPEPPRIESEDAAEAPPTGGFAHTVAATVIDVDALVAAGFRRDDVENLRERVDAIDLARLELHDRAMREGWADTPRFSQENRALNEATRALRGEFGDELYDWMLYSTGQPNRVAIGDVLGGSAAEAAGLASGDVILRYDDRLVLDALELRNATFAGRAGEWVAIEVIRSGEAAPRRYFVPRGPIGVRLAPAIVEPSRPG